ncbi:MAG: class I SAM-dependent methyltransferase [Mangrovibacterium sp.]
MNVFKDFQVAQTYDSFYQTSLGEAVDRIEKALIRGYLDQMFSCETSMLHCNVRGYDNKFQQHGNWSEAEIREASSIRPLKNKLFTYEMLELGCGTGHWTQFFCDEGFHVTGVDESGAMLEQARAKHIVPAGFLEADAGNLPFPDQRFSVISSVTMFEFVDDVNRIFDEIDRVLKPGGCLLCGWLNALSEPAKKKNDSETFRHARFYTPTEVERMLTRFGLPQLSYGVYYSPGFDLLDGTEAQNSVQPAFIASFVQKI